MAVMNKNKYPRYGWYLYDFANSILIINGGLYFPQWIVKENDVDDWIYNLSFILSSVFLILVGPLLGLSVDKKKELHFKYLLFSSLTLILAGIVVGMAPLIQVRSTRIVVALSAFVLILISYQLSLIFYNTLLDRVAASDDYERVSARALAWGWGGGIFGIFFGLLFVGDSTGGMNSIAPSALLAGALTSVSLFLLSRDPADHQHGVIERAAPNKPSGSWDSIVGLKNNTPVWMFLAAYFFFSDAVLTLQNNATIYMQAVLNLTDNQKAFQFLLVLVTGVAGSLASVPLARAFGLRRALIWTLTACMVVVITTPLFTTVVGFSSVFGLLGFLNGAVWNISRVMFFRIVPSSRRNTYFGFYSTFERFSSIIGPVAWSIAVSSVQSEPFRYQLAWSGMGIFYLASIALLVRLRTPEVETKG